MADPREVCAPAEARRDGFVECAVFSSCTAGSVDLFWLPRRVASATWIEPLGFARHVSLPTLHSFVTTEFLWETRWSRHGVRSRCGGGCIGWSEGGAVACRTMSLSEWPDRAPLQRSCSGCWGAHTTHKQPTDTNNLCAATMLRTQSGKHRPWGGSGVGRLVGCSAPVCAVFARGRALAGLGQLLPPHAHGLSPSAASTT